MIPGATEHMVARGPESWMDRPAPEVIHVADETGLRCARCGRRIVGDYSRPYHEGATVVVLNEDRRASWRTDDLANHSIRSDCRVTN